MANEIDVTVALAMSKVGVSASRSEGFKVTMGGDAITHSVQAIGTSAEVLALSAEFAASAKDGWIFIKNLDSTNYVEFGSVEVTSTDGDDAAEYAIKLLAGESCAFRAASTIYAKANTATCNVEFLAIEE